LVPVPVPRVPHPVQTSRKTHFRALFDRTRIPRIEKKNQFT
jgi:hypothetical protein